MPLIGRRDIPIKRDEVFEWLHGVKREDFREVMQQKLASKGLEDTMVDMGEETGNVSLLDVLMMEFG